MVLVLSAGKIHWFTPNIFSVLLFVSIANKNSYIFVYILSIYIGKGEAAEERTCKDGLNVEACEADLCLELCEVIYGVNATGACVGPLATAVCQCLYPC